MTYITDILDNPAMPVPAEGVGRGGAVGYGAHGAADEEAPGGVEPGGGAVHQDLRLGEVGAARAAAVEAAALAQAVVEDNNASTELTEAALMLDQAIAGSDKQLMRTAVARLEHLRDRMQVPNQSNVGDGAPRPFPPLLSNLVDQASAAILSDDGVDAFSSTVMLKELKAAMDAFDARGVEDALSRIDALPARNGQPMVPAQVVRDERLWLLEQHAQAMPGLDGRRVSELMRSVNGIEPAGLTPALIDSLAQTQTHLTEVLQQTFAEAGRSDAAVKTFLEALEAKAAAAVPGTAVASFAENEALSTRLVEYARGLQTASAAQTSFDSRQAQALRDAVDAAQLPAPAHEAVVSALLKVLGEAEVREIAKARELGEFSSVERLSNQLQSLIEALDPQSEDGRRAVREVRESLDSVEALPRSFPMDPAKALNEAVATADSETAWRILDAVDALPDLDAEVKAQAEKVRDLMAHGGIGRTDDMRTGRQALLALLQGLGETNEEALRAALTDADALRNAPAPVRELVRRMLAEAAPQDSPLIALTDEEMTAILQVRQGVIGNVDQEKEELREEIEVFIAAIRRNLEAPAPQDDGIQAIRNISLGFGVLRGINAFEAEGAAEALVRQLVLAREADDPREGLEALSTVAHEILKHRDRAKAVAVLAARNTSPADRLQARRVIEDGPGLGQELLERLQTVYQDVCRELMVRSLPGDLAESVSGVDLGTLAELAARTGTAPDVLFKAVEQALSAQRQAAGSPRYCADLVHALAEYAQAVTAEDPAGRRDLLNCINLLFAPGMPELADEALLVKEALLPGDADAARIEHALSLAHARLMQRMMDRPVKSASSFVEAAFGRAGSLSGRSFILDPRAMQALRSKFGNAASVEYEIANLAVLERTALNAGVLVLDEAQAAKVLNEQEWVDALNLPLWAQAYAKKLDAAVNGEQTGTAAQREALLTLTTVAQVYGKGLAGEEALRDAIVAIQVNSSAFEKQNPERLLENAPGYREAIVLNRLLGDLTGIVSWKDRRGDGVIEDLALNDQVIDGNMRARTARMIDRMNSGERRKLSEFLADNRANRGRAAQTGGRFERNVALLTNLAAREKRSVRLSGEAKVLSARMAHMTSAKKTVRFAWFERHDDNLRESAQSVIDFCRAHDELLNLQTNHPDPSPQRLEKCARQMQEARRRLRGVDPERMRHVAGRTEVPTDEQILQMRQGAEAIAYFDPRLTGVDGFSQADLDAAQFDQIVMLMDRNGQTLEDLRAKFEDIVGKKFRSEINDTVAAAFLKVSCESPRGTGIALKNPEEKRVVVEQLKSWGLPLDDPFIQVVVGQALGRMTLPDGTFNPVVLKKYWASTRRMHHEEGRIGLREFNRGLGFFTPRQPARLEAIAPAAARRKEGVRRILDMASVPGATVVYSKTRGINADTGAIYMPWSKMGDGMFSDGTLPVSAQARLLDEGAFSVSNLGAKGFQVLVKDGESGRLGGAFSLGLPTKLVKLKAKIAGGVGGSSGQGVVLNFPDGASCRAFIDAMMAPEETGTEKEKIQQKKDFYRTVLRASQIRMVDEAGVTGDLSATLIGTVASRVLAADKDVGSVSGVLAATAGISLKGDVSETMQTNAHGSIVTLKRHGTLTLSSAVAGSLVGVVQSSGPRNPTVKMAPGLVPASIAGILEGSKELRLVTNELGVSPETGMTESYNVTGIALKRPLIRHFVLGRKIAEARKSDARFAEKLSAFLDKVEKGDTVAVKFAITPEALTAVRREILAARTAGLESAEGRRHIDEVGRLLNADASYRPAKVVITTGAVKKLVEWSPGLGMVQYVRQNTLSTQSPRDAFEINLLDQE